MKRKIAVFGLIFVMVFTMFALAGCGGGSDEDSSEAEETAAEESDLAYVQGNGKLIVGITDFAPMDYKDDDGNWVGFDADMAAAFAESLGVEAEFIEIDWDSKEMELENKSIDCVWNGMTLTDAVKAAMETSNAYCNNAQVVVVKSDVADKYQDKDACAELNFAVESGSAGADAVAEEGWNAVEVQTQASALMEVEAGTADAAVIDLLMAGAMIGEGTSYTDLTYTVELTSEEYGVGFRKGSDLAAALNSFMSESYAAGTMQEIAEKYGTQESLIAQ